MHVTSPGRHGTLVYEGARAKVMKMTSLSERVNMAKPFAMSVKQGC